MEGIVVSDVNYTYSTGIRTLKEISLHLYRGESVSLLGPNGAGKTTLIKLLNGLLKPTTGEVFIDGQKTTETPVSKLARKVGVVFQNAEKQFFAETVYNELAFAPQNMGFTLKEIKERVETVAKTFGIERYLERSPFSISGGEKKRLSIASVLVSDPTYVIIDEPTVGLDFHYRKLLVDIIKKIIKEGKTVLVVTHDIDFALLTCKRVILIADGMIIKDGSIYETLLDDKLIEQASLVPTFTLRILDALVKSNYDKNKISDLIETLNFGELKF